MRTVEEMPIPEAAAWEKKCRGGQRKSLKRLDSAKELRHLNLDFVPPDLEFVPPGLDFVPKNLDFLHPAGGAALPALAQGRLRAPPPRRLKSGRLLAWRLITIPIRQRGYGRY